MRGFNRLVCMNVLSIPSARYTDKADGISKHYPPNGGQQEKLARIQFDDQ